MSNQRAIAAVTATLRSILFQALTADTRVSGAQVTTRAPDRARPEGATGNQLNLFLYRTSINAAWRNQDPVGLRPGETGQPALPLVLSYLLTAYSENDDEIVSHELIGVGMKALNDQPLLSAADILAENLDSELENQIERVRITPNSLSLDEISRLWATFQTGYRISASYDVSVVLIDSGIPSKAALPVLSRGEGDVGPNVLGALPPILDLALPPGGAPAARAGDVVTLFGRRLEAVTTLSLSGLRLKAAREFPAAAMDDGSIQLDLPKGKDALPAGTLLVSAIASTPAGPLASADIPLGLAPTLTNKSQLKATLDAGQATVKVRCAPPVEPGQTVALVIGDRVVAAPPGSTGTQLTFNLAGFEAGTFTVRLRIDGQDSIPLGKDLFGSDLPDDDPRKKDLPTFDPIQTVVLS